ncbi:MAG TPA: hypothetical protein VHL34_11520 [Rhizomicrobium sp.]|jgi:outer membrane protein OmpA-like peptidoglycan-associated protein|nr:hypothetical protein [Rhizomicrobium sp.]
MKRAVATTLGCAFVALAAPAWAQQQDMYPGQSVVVNPQAGGTQVLLYPDGTHTRVVPQLLQPGDPGNQIIHLHMPVKRKVVHRAPKPVEVASVPDSMPDYTAPAPPPPPTRVASVPKPAPAKPAQRPVVVKPASAPVETASNNSGGGIGFSFDSRTANYAAPTEQPKKMAANKPAPVTTNPTAAPSAGNSNGAGGSMTRRSQIIFAAGAADPAPNALDAIRLLGGDLNSALAGGASRIQLQAYGGPKNDKSSDARRISLKRALAIRQLFIDAGVPSTKIDVRAMGGADTGPLDRVDVYLRG